MKHLLKYLGYVIEHKVNVFKACVKRKLYGHAITHDLSKFSPKEFFAYARYFYIDRQTFKTEFEEAWKHHYQNNPHHWQYWLKKDGTPKPIPYKYLEQMAADWEGMALKFGDTAQGYYLKNYKKINMEYNSRMWLEHILDLNVSMHHNYGHTLEDLLHVCGEEWWDRNQGFMKDKYGVDLKQILAESNGG